MMDLRQYEAETAVWRAKLDNSLQKENGWLALAGLFWLHEGDNSFGSQPDDEIQLPLAQSEHLGVFRLTADTVTLHVAPEAAVLVDDETVQTAVLQQDESDTPSLVTVEQIAMMVLQRESVYAIRMWDNGRSERQTFPGRQWYPLQEQYHVTGQFTPYTSMETLTLSRSVGADFEETPVGYVNFVLQGKEYCLTAFKSAAGLLFLPFKDATNGDTTYKAGRYLTAVLPQDGTITLDFNRAYHPPCFYTHYATCTLPPRENWLDIAIEAGEHM